MERKKKARAIDLQIAKKKNLKGEKISTVSENDMKGFFCLFLIFILFCFQSTMHT